MSTVALVGAGRWGSNYVRVLGDLGALSMVCDPQAKVLGVRMETDVSAALADPAISGVVIATPSATHAEIALQALHRGKDVLIEKPMCFSVADSAMLLRAQEASGSILMVGHLLRYHPGVVRLIELVRSGAVGDVCRVSCVRWSTEDNGDDPLWDLAPHDVSIVLAMFDTLPVSRPHVLCASQHSTDISLLFGDGIEATISVALAAPRKIRMITVTGTQGIAIFEDGRTPRLSRIGVESVEEQLPSVEPLVAQCRHFLECMRTRETPLTDGAEAYRVIAVLEACTQMRSPVAVHG